MEPQATEKPLVLVADDEAHILHVVSLKLRNAGYEVLTAHDGEEAMELALQHHPALVITDFQMPFMTGLELCVKLKQTESTRDIPAIMLTARGFAMAEDDLNPTNIAAVLSKPFSPRDVLAKVQELIDHQAGNPA